MTTDAATAACVACGGPFVAGAMRYHVPPERFASGASRVCCSPECASKIAPRIAVCGCGWIGPEGEHGDGAFCDA